MAHFTTDVKELMIEDWLDDENEVIGLPDSTVTSTRRKVGRVSFWHDLYDKAAKKLTHLTTLSITNSQITEVLVKGMAEMKNLRSLRIYECDAEMFWLPRHPRIAWISAERTIAFYEQWYRHALLVQERWAMFLPVLMRLEELHTDSWPITDMFLRTDPKLQYERMRVLRIGPMEITEKTWLFDNLDLVVPNITSLQLLVRYKDSVPLNHRRSFPINLSRFPLNLHRVQVPLPILKSSLLRPLTQLDWAGNQFNDSEPVPRTFFSEICGETMTVLSLPWRNFSHHDIQECFPKLRTLTIIVDTSLQELQAAANQRQLTGQEDLHHLRSGDVNVPLVLAESEAGAVLRLVTQPSSGRLLGWNLDAWHATITQALTDNQFPSLTRFEMVDRSLFVWHRDLGSASKDGWKPSIPHCNRRLARLYLVDETNLPVYYVDRNHCIQSLLDSTPDMFSTKIGRSIVSPEL
ncbi:hypothetical protein D9758_013414 [Tetrapyrgos nigripes]|uniref:Uncharacterized protein n=1 Tax=Tetrapyrgos nigripes TaxID=182062 RepID=A0A8H5CLQ0_9AGAR|nr:hypothetical protein D9758_013414 [Tetrapyrgos nigripes]